MVEEHQLSGDASLNAVREELTQEILEEMWKEFPQKKHTSKTFGTPDSYDTWNVYDYEDYDTANLESCQKLIQKFEEVIKKWSGK